MCGEQRTEGSEAAETEAVRGADCGMGGQILPVSQNTERGGDKQQRESGSTVLL